MEDRVRSRKRSYRRPTQKTTRRSRIRTPLRSPLYFRRRRDEDSDDYEYYNDDADEPFWVTVLKVGVSLLVICAIMFVMGVVLWSSEQSSLPFFSSSEKEKVEEPWAGIGTPHAEGDVAPISSEDPPLNSIEVEEEKILSQMVLPNFKLGAASETDAFALAEKFLPGQETWSKKKGDLMEFLKTAHNVRRIFTDNYGGENAARFILEQGLTTFDKIDQTRNESSNQVPESILHLARRIKDARNTKRKFVMAFTGSSAAQGRGNYVNDSYPMLLKQILGDLMPLLGIEFEVRAHAMNDISSFPMGWCLDSMIGEEIDVLVWDFGQTEEGNDKGQGFEAYIRRAMTMDRKPMIILRDSQPSQPRHTLLQKYVDMGALVDPVAVSVDSVVGPFFELLKEANNERLPDGLEEWSAFSGPPGGAGQTRKNMSRKHHELVGWILSMRMLSAMELVSADILNRKEKLLGKENVETKYGSRGALPPPISQVDETKTLPSISFGVQTEGENDWIMNPVHCRSTFTPTVHGSFEDIVVSGTTATDIELHKPRGPMFYNSAWTLDLGGENAKGVNAIEAVGATYYGMKICYNISIPEGATLSTRKEMEDATEKEEMGTRGLKGGRLSKKKVASNLGLPLEITVTNTDVTWKNGACSISHVIWEQFHDT
eukprot:scaffold119162_cov55-Attheya_sp.AAC.1